MMFVNVGESRIWGKGQQKLFGVTIDKNLKFKEHILKQCKRKQEKTKCFGKSLQYFKPLTSKLIKEDIC